MTDLCDLSLDSAELQDQSRKTKPKKQSCRIRVENQQITKGKETERLKHQKYKNCNVT